MTPERLPVKVGIDTHPTPMTHAQAMRWGNANIPRSLREAGFTTTVFRSDPEIHGSHFFRVNWGK